jgi:hypothetical protein
MKKDGFSGLKGRYGTILIDPPWRFLNRTGKMAPEHKRLRRYPTMSFDEIGAAGRRPRLAAKPPLSMVPECALARSTSDHEAMGVRLQDEHRLVQDPQRRRPRRSRGGLLFR